MPSLEQRLNDIERALADLQHQVDRINTELQIPYQPTFSKETEMPKDPKKTSEPVGHALYCPGDITIAFEAGRTAGEYAARGEYLDVHCTDAALEGLHQIHGLLRKHKDIPEPVGAPPASAEDCGVAIVALCDANANQPVAADADEAGLNPAMILALFQLGKFLADLYFKWRS